MSFKLTKFALVGGLLALAGLLVVCGNQAQSESNGGSEVNLVERGRHLVQTGDCGICHTPKIFTEKGPVEDSSKLFMGHPADLAVPEVPVGALGPDKWGTIANPHFTAWAGPWGVSFASNLTPDNLTGSGAWTEEAFIQAMRNGKHLGRGRQILPPMPWQAVGHHTDEELKAMLAFFKSLPAIRNQVPQPIPPGGPPTE